MARRTKLTPYNGGQWTLSRFNQHIIGGLRKASVTWGPAKAALAAARVRRGWYLCASCGQEIPASIPAVYKSGKKKGRSYRAKNAIVDHINPVVDPHIGFTTWDEYIRRMFVELDGYQVLCLACHKIKTAEERAIATQRRRENG